MSAVLKLAHDESVRLDRSQLEVLYQSLGPIGADKVVNHALEEISISLTRGVEEYRAGRLDELRGTVREIKPRKVVVAIDLLAEGEVCVRGEVTAVRLPENWGQ